jgi:hypothetical protein
MQYRNSPRLLLDHTDGKPERSPRRRTKGAFDRDKLNVRWSVENDRTTLLRVSSKADCQNDAWFRDDALSRARDRLRPNMRRDQSVGRLEHRFLARLRHDRSRLI